MSDPCTSSSCFQKTVPGAAASGTVFPVREASARSNG